MSNEVKTWADGHGRWHAEVPGNESPVMAAHAIAEEIYDRSNQRMSFEEVIAYVGEHLVSLPSEEPGRVHFAEYSI